jgi:hypothetical protein
MNTIIAIFGIATCLLFIFRVVTYYYIYFRSERNDVEDFAIKKDLEIGFRDKGFTPDLFSDFKFYVPDRLKSLQRASTISLRLFYFAVIMLIALVLIGSFL